MTDILRGTSPLAGDERGPLYLRLQEMIRSAIVDGHLVPNDALPAERELASSLGVSRVTVRKAIQGLVVEGVLRQRHGSGTYVSRGAGKVEQPLSRLTSFTEDMQARGMVSTSAWLERSVGMPTTAEAMVLGLAPTERVSRLYRLRMANNEPMAIERAVIPARILPDPASIDRSLYDTLAGVGMRPIRAVQRLNAENVGGPDAALLGIATGSAALAIERTSYLSDGRVVEFTRSLYRGDAYDFVAELQLRTS